MKAALVFCCALLLLGLAVPAQAQASCQLPAVITSAVAFDSAACPVVNLSSDATVSEAGKLTITGSAVTVDGPRVLTVAGELELRNAAFSRPAASGSMYQIILGATAKATIDTVTFEGYDRLLVKSSQTTVLKDVKVSHATTALTVDGGHLSATGLKVESTPIGLKALGAADILLVDSSLSDGTPQLQFQAANGAAPHVRLLDTTVPESALPNLPDGVQVEWLSRLTVGVSGASGPVTVSSADKNGRTTPWTPSDSVPGAYDALLAYKTRNQAGTFSPNPGLVWARSGQTVANLPFDVIQKTDRQPIAVGTLSLGTDADTQAPQWQSGPTQGGLTDQGVMSLTWSAPDETAGGHANRAIARYEVVQDPGPGEKILSWIQDGLATSTARAATAVKVAGIGAGTHSFVIRAHDLAGNHADSTPITLSNDRLAIVTEVSRDAALSGFYGQPVDLKITSPGATTITTRVDGKEPVAYSGPISFGREGTDAMLNVWRDDQGPGALSLTSADVAKIPLRIKSAIEDATKFPVQLSLLANEKAQLLDAFHQTSRVSWGGNAYGYGFSIAQNFPGDGIFVVDIQARDSTRVSNTRFYLPMDLTPPTLVADLSPSVAPGMWSPENFTLYTAADDAGSGMAQTTFRVDGGPWSGPISPAKALPLVKGVHTIDVNATDNVGHSTIVSLVAAYDPDAPVIHLDVPAATGHNGWHLAPTNVSVDIDAPSSGFQGAQFRLDSGQWVGLQGPIHISSAGKHVLEVRASNAAGLTVSNQTAVDIDMDDPVPPQPKWIWQASGARADWRAAPPYDASSGIERILVEEQVNGVVTLLLELPASATHAELDDLAPGDHQLRIRVRDVAGRSAATPWRSESMRVVEQAPSSQLATGVHRLAPASTDGLEEARFYVDGQLTASVGEPPFLFDWDTRALVDGRHEVAIVTLDQEGGVHEAVTDFEVRNSYAAVVHDNLLAYTAAAGSLVLALGAAIAALRKAQRSAA